MLSIIIEYYMAQCPDRSVLSLIALDNLDALPTEHIERVTNCMYDLASTRKNLPILMPLRPSSITPEAFDRPPFYRLHYGPDVANMVKRRLLDFVLKRSKEALTNASVVRRESGTALALDGMPFPFSSTPSENDYRCLVICSYIYALLQCSRATGRTAVRDRATLESAKQALKKGVEALNRELNEDHVFLADIDFRSDTIVALAETLHALVGRSSRYAYVQLEAFFKNLYRQPELLAGAIRSFAAGRLRKPLRLRYGSLINTMVGAEDAHGDGSRVANIFRRHGMAQSSRPSLVPLRILGMLRFDKRVRARALLSQLSRKGIPADVAVDSLNYLHNRRRLLLWFSNNRNMGLSTTDLSQYIVLSEHGKHYYDTLAGDFEYLWYCSSRLSRNYVVGRKSTFPEKLNSYRRLISEVGDTEWKQIVFERTLTTAVDDRSETVATDELYVLSLLYSSMRRLATSTDTVLSSAWPGPQYGRDVNAVLRETCGLILKWQERYETAYRSTGYLLRYGQGLEEMTKAAVMFLLQSPGIAGRTRDVLDKVVSSWSAPARFLPLSKSGYSGRVATSLDTGALRQSLDDSGMFGIGDLVKNTSSEEVLRSLAKFTWARQELADLLENTFPTYHRVYGLLSLVLRRIGALISRLRLEEFAGSSEGERLVQFLLEEAQEVRNWHHVLSRNAIDVDEFCAREEMSRLKRRSNRIVQVYRECAEVLCTAPTPHLDVSWQ